MLEFDIYDRKFEIVKTKGYSAGPRKNHCATMFNKSMIVYGGVNESGSFLNEMIVLQVDTREWLKLNFKNGMQPFVQGACCTVLPIKKRTSGKAENA